MYQILKHVESNLVGSVMGLALVSVVCLMAGQTAQAIEIEMYF